MCSGVVLRRWKALVADTRADIDLVVLANHVQVINEQRTNVLLTKELVSDSGLLATMACSVIKFSNT